MACRKEEDLYVGAFLLESKRTLDDISMLAALNLILVSNCWHWSRKLIYKH